jgi:hypothetical protein
MAERSNRWPEQSDLVRRIGNCRTGRGAATERHCWRGPPSTFLKRDLENLVRDLPTTLTVEIDEMKCDYSATLIQCSGSKGISIKSLLLHCSERHCLERRRHCGKCGFFWTVSRL